MTSQLTAIGRAAAVCLLAATTACGSLGNVLGGVLGSPQSDQGQGQVSGRIAGVDQRTQQIAIQASNGQTVTLLYDNQTAVVYQNQNYPVTALERGDQVTARVQSTNGGEYYTDLVQVDQSVSSTGGASGNVQSFQGTVGQIDQSNGAFRLDGSSASLVVTLPYNVRQSDLNTFRQLRVGDRVRLYGVILNNSRVELRQFY
jgi:exosome complex RNA-binding protein Csl4